MALLLEVAIAIPSPLPAVPFGPTKLATVLDVVHAGEGKSLFFIIQLDSLVEVTA